jgi:hypothetical protein
MFRNERCFINSNKTSVGLIVISGVSVLRKMRKSNGVYCRWFRYLVHENWINEKHSGKKDEKVGKGIIHDFVGS